MYNNDYIGSDSIYSKYKEHVLYVRESIIHFILLAMQT